MAVKNYYAMLELLPAASAEEIKKSFRAQIARYHPDKVQHLGKEFAALAAERAAELTEAYRILSDAGRRAEYDRALSESGETPPTFAASPAAAAPRERERAPEGERDAAETPNPAAPRGAQFREERATRDEFVRKATLGRLRQAIDAVGPGYEESQLRGFDIAWLPKKKLFGSNSNPRLLGRFVSQLDREAVADAWLQAVKSGQAGHDEVCVLLLGTALAPAGELAAEIAVQRKKSRGAKITVIPVDARVWHAHIPLDAPVLAKTLLARLRTGA